MTRVEGDNRPLISMTEWTTPPRYGVMDDIGFARDAGLGGIGLWEGKFRGASQEQVIDAIGEAGLSATFCLTEIFSILPMPFGPPSEQDPEVRVDMICEAIPRLAAFEPVALMMAPGISGDPDVPAGPIDVLAEGLAQIADVAAENGLKVAFELLAGRRGSPLPTLEKIVEFIDDLGRANIDVLFDVYHSWDEPGLHHQIRKHADRIIGVQVCDIRHQERGNFDRELPGLGRRVAPEIMATLLSSGYDGWWEIEVFSDDGSLGTDYPGSYWKRPMAEFLSDARKSVEGCYQDARTMVSR